MVTGSLPIQRQRVETSDESWPLVVSRGRDAAVQRGRARHLWGCTNKAEELLGFYFFELSLAKVKKKKISDAVFLYSVIG